MSYNWHSCDMLSCSTMQVACEYHFVPGPYGPSNLGPTFDNCVQVDSNPPTVVFEENQGIAAAYGTLFVVHEGNNGPSGEGKLASCDIRITSL